MSWVAGPVLMIYTSLFGNPLACSRADSCRHVNCCNPEIASNGGWGIFNAILGWQNSATIGSVVSYCVYWIFVTVALIVMRVDEGRVARGQATLLRTLLGKGPKLQGNEGTVFVQATDEEPDTVLKNGLQTGAERDLQNLSV
jgi:hypothetical protein